MLLGLTGFKRSGKDTTAGYLARYGFVKHAFADALRSMAYATDPAIALAGAPQLRSVLGFRTHMRYSAIIDAIGYESAKEIPDFRRFLQRLGSEGVRDTFGEDAWVQALDRVLPSDLTEDHVVITDVRFPNEAEYVHARGGEMWRIVRPGYGGDDPHPSEIHIASLPVDAEIEATDLDSLERAIEYVLQGLSLQVPA